MWLRVVHDENIPVKENSSLYFDESISQLYIDCRNMKTADLQVYYISPGSDKDINGIYQIENMSKLKFIKVEKGDLMENKILKTICKR